MTALEEILQGMGGLDIDFSYEDGLRLSELSGQLARSEYMLDHIWTTNLWIFGYAATVSIVLVVFYLMYAASRIPAPEPEKMTRYVKARNGHRTKMEVSPPRSIYDDDEDSEAYLERRRREREQTIADNRRQFRMAALRGIAMAVPVALIIIAMGYVAAKSGIEADIASFSAQIEAIISRYEVI